jgi:transposase, IS30 family
VRKMLMLVDREEISRGLAESLEYKEIGVRLGRDASVISREVARHGGRQRYRAAAAHEAACAGRERPKLFAVERSPRLRAVVCQQLRDGWSPASIAGRLPTEYAADESCRVSHEAIYQWVYAQPVSTLARELISLRTGRKARKGGRRPPPAPRIREPVYLDDRPAEVQGRAVPGHWEGDLVIGKGDREGRQDRRRDPGRAHVSVPHPGALDRARLTDGRQRGHRGHPRSARPDPPVAELGLRVGDGPTRHDHRDRTAGVFRPPALPVGTRQQREPQPHRPRVLPQRCDDHLGPHLSGDGGFRHQRPTP